MAKKPKAIDEFGAGDGEAAAVAVEPSGGEQVSPEPSLAPDIFVGPDGRLWRRRHEPRGSGWRDWSELAE